MAEEIREIDENEYIGIAEFARRAKVSCQAIYQQLDKKLKPYLIEIDGKKKLNIKALSEVYGDKSEEVVEPLLEILTQQLMEKDKQLTEKDKQIDGLIKSLSLSQMQLTEATHRLQELTDKSHEEPDQEEGKRKIPWWKKIL